MKLTANDHTALDAALDQAHQAYSAGNYPVGAAIMIGNKLVTGQNAGETSGNYANHAESSLIVQHGVELLSAFRSGESATLYSTLEPCLMCLGTATMLRISRIVYITSDPHAGACGLDRFSMGARYHTIWPEIIHAKGYNDEAKQLLINYVQKQIDLGQRVEANRPIIEALHRAT